MTLALIVLTAAYLALGLAYFGRRRADYSHLRHTISELAEAGSVTEKVVSFALFLPVGLLAGLTALLVQGNEAAVLFLASLAIGYVGAALFPIDRDAPFVGGWRNAVHNLLAGLSYVVAIGAFERVALDRGFPYSAGKFLILGFLVSLYIPVLRDFRGLMQRVVEVGIFAALVSVVLLLGA